MVKIRTKDISGAKKMTLVEIEGALDTLAIAETEKVLNPLIESEEGFIIIDCSKLSYINTVGVVLLLRYHIKAKRKNGGFKIVNLTKTVYEIMEISGALKLLEVYKEIEEAIDSIYTPEVEQETTLEQ
ncbi:hypothetical protein DRJ17_07365 [Candidatus Woesearchaeota archaeon]|nr:MAG: hypothetical protein DRJ17_07365 [Candidatus Woesearchaeota archaeon]